MINWSLVVQMLPVFWDGLQMTLILLVAAGVAGLILAVPLAVARTARSRWLAWPAFGYTYVIRGTPLLVQLFIIYYGLPQFGLIRNSALWPLLRDPWFCAWLAFTLNTTAYTAEIFAGAIRTTPSGEIEAARAMGLSRAQVFRDVFWPGAWRRALPQYGNEVVQLMHATALASTVTIVEILRVGRDVYTNYLVIPESFGLAAVFYLGLTVLLTTIFRLLERHFLRHLDPRSSITAAPAEPRKTTAHA
ncbi:ABC transporter permease [Paracoccus aestuarii]|uniref:ABC transporter permease n=1 Tax=Paracoccus aestuarii TaxID=453842 RepID=A0A419A0Y7_9RHOB|nr:ABC transporter permease [Paracoccus aestuarii]RJL06648.1 ABC transporter permease [Paracoccus aestuarii]WCR00906.1 ABC transporter permease [Paracoccus aestuarii]